MSIGADVDATGVGVDAGGVGENPIVPKALFAVFMSLLETFVDMVFAH